MLQLYPWYSTYQHGASFYCWLRSLAVLWIVNSTLCMPSAGKAKTLHMVCLFCGSVKNSSRIYFGCATAAYNKYFTVRFSRLLLLFD
ncbi:hypothetical protein PDJAM_G00229750 [Pangasius djambal]|uniref:Uncharacterized protein n=1 Tax=Pangasius djambal TaxID=1691987 RepID=A0ACC5YE57_9TELE|nr:hypothetical protein [Pangasius djambal]